MIFADADVVQEFFNGLSRGFRFDGAARLR